MKLITNLLASQSFDAWELIGRVEELEPQDVWGLVCRIESLEDELADLRQARGPMKGGPPVEWDRWTLELPREEFLECLGPKDSEDIRRRISSLRARQLPGSWGAFVA